MSTTCLVTGGAGFIGCAISPTLPGSFDRVVAFDNLHPQVHATRSRPRALDSRVELVEGDVTSAADWDALLAEVAPTVVIHLAAETGTAQSLTEASRHAAVNVVGTAELLDALVRHDVLPETIALTSSRAVYGEGAWADARGELTYPGQRSLTMLESGQWDFTGLRPTPVEASRTMPHPTSVYGSTKLAQEHVLRCWCLAMGVAPVVLRLQNVYGPGQSITNPYTGIVSLFALLARAGEVIPVYEDGDIVRDFVYIDDVASALVRAVTLRASERVYDVGQGRPTTVLELAAALAAHYGAPRPQVNGRFRNGDVRAASCDISATTARLGWTPSVALDDGVARLCAWLEQQVAEADEPGAPTEG